MSWTKKNLATSAAFAALLGATHAFANSVIVRSTGPSAKTYSPGKSLADNSVLPLKAGDIVTILDARGTRVLKGPGTISTGAAATATGSGFNQLLRNTGARQARTGATRNTPVTASLKSPNLWFIDSAKSGSFCVKPAAAVSVWRSNGSAATAITLTRINDGKSSVITFGSGQTVTPWPASILPVVDGSEFRMASPGMQSSTIKIAILSRSDSNPSQVAADLIEKGCTVQLDLLVDAGSRQSGAGGN